MPTLDQIVNSIDAHLNQLQREIASLEAARGALRGEGPTARGALRGNGDAAAAEAVAEPDAPARRPRARTRTRKKPARSGQAVEVLLAGKLEAMLGESEAGLSAVTISKRANAGYNQVLELLRDLEGSGRVRRSGTRRTSLWRVVTDEERIAERAAELEALSAAKSPA